MYAKAEANFISDFALANKHNVEKAPKSTTFTKKDDLRPKVTRVEVRKEKDLSIEPTIRNSSSIRRSLDFAALKCMSLLIVKAAKTHGCKLKLSKLLKVASN